MAFVSIFIVRVMVALMIVIVVVVGYNWLVMVVGVWVAPVHIASVPGVVRVLSNWLLNIESSVVVIVGSMSNLLVWHLVDLNSVMISVAMIIVIPLMMV